MEWRYSWWSISSKGTDGHDDKEKGHETQITTAGLLQHELETQRDVWMEMELRTLGREGRYSRRRDHHPELRDTPRTKKTQGTCNNSPLPKLYGKINDKTIVSNDERESRLELLVVLRSKTDDDGSLERPYGTAG